MALSTAIDISRSSLATTSELTEIVSRNIGNVSNSGSSRKIAGVVTDAGGGARVSQITRSATGALRDGVVGATSDAARLAVVVSSLDKLDMTGGDSSNADSPAGRLGALKASLQVYSSNTADQTSAASLLASASNLVSTLHDWARNTLEVRKQADSDIRDAVTNLNTMLKQIGELDIKIVNGTIAGADVTDQLDARDVLVGSIAEQIGVTVVGRPNNSIALYTDSGITLFDQVPRSVSVQPVAITDGASGGAVVIDGIPAVGANSVMPAASGRIVGLVQVRDVTAPAFAAQLDDIAGSLIRAFAEKDQGTPATLPDAAGLFTSASLSAPPAAGASNPGLARSIEVNANVDPTRGGDLMRLRDGAISNPGNPAYVYNTTGATGFNGRVQQLVDLMAKAEIHDPASGLPSSTSLGDYAASSIGWLQGQRQTAAQDSSYANTLLQRSQAALQRDAGVNIDDEMTKLLGLERTYQASAKLITTVDNMFGALMQAIG